jgi:hypothetical protein
MCVFLVTVFGTPGSILWVIQIICTLRIPKFEMQHPHSLHRMGTHLLSLEGANTSHVDVFDSAAEKNK